MLARLYLLMPYTVTVREGEEFPVYEAVDGDYKVLFLPPMRDPAMLKGRRPKSITLDGKPAIEANVMRIDFQKNDFDRASGHSVDPPEQVIQRAVGEFHARLRFTTRAAHAEPVQFPWNQWRLEYTNDDGSPLETREGYVKGRGTQGFRWSFIGLSQEIWDYMFGLPPEFEVPVWDGLRLDAQAALPKVGTALVLAATSLEVFISVLLDDLASHKGMSTPLWDWIKNREGDIRQQPSVEDQFDVLLKEFCGHSLKEEVPLWEAFKNIKTARNTFVHEGTAKIGGSIVTVDKATALIPRVNEIISKVREWIPEKLRWPAPQINVQVEATHALIEPSNQAQQSPN
jgi:hypothetical protein